MMAPGKVKRGFTEGDEDRISQLTDDLIGNLLSRLPTIQAVRTYILSKDWEHKWTFISKIQMDSNNKGWDGKERFVNFVQKMSQRVRNVTAIYFKCDSYLYDKSVLTSIVSGFLKYKADMLHIDLDDKEIVVCSRLFSWATLRELELHFLFFKTPTENCFPHLKTLCLDRIEISICELEISNEMTLRFTFPVLQTLEICNCTWPNVKLVEIYAPLQKVESCTDYENGAGDYEIKIFGATGPLFFDSYGDFLDNILFIRSNLVSARILHSDDDHLETLHTTEVRVRNLLRESLSTLVDLQLSPCIAQFLAKVILESKHGSCLPVFRKLERLYLYVDVNYCPGYTEALFDLLHAATLLKFLDIRTLYGGWGGDYDYDAMESIPSCLLSTLKEIKLHIVIGGVGDDELMSQVRLAKFLVQICGKAKLKRFYCQIHAEDVNYYRRAKLMELISSFPRAPPHFTLCVVMGWSKRHMKRFSYRESGWVEDV